MAALRAETGVRGEVVPAREFDERAIGQGYRAEEVARQAGRFALVLENGDDPVSGEVDLHVRETEGWVSDELDRRLIGGPPEQEPVARELGEDDDAIAHGVGAAPVLVDPRAHVELWGHVRDRAVRAAPQEGHAAGLLGTRFEEVHVAAVLSRLGESVPGAHGHLDADGGRP